ncbi:MAG: DMT family transporter [Geminicoccaceae bacterium]|nr:MAG: DMT family transporter [Geminicoccaceae bacterium]
MLLMVGAMLLVPAMDAVAKHLSAVMVPAQIALARFGFQVVFMTPLVRGRRLEIAPGDLALHGLRGVLLALATTFFFAALAVMPMAEAIAIFFVEPLLLSLLAGILLKEGIGWRRILAILVGFAGAMLIVRPGLDAFGWAATLPLVAALFFALYLVATRVLAQRTDPVTLQLTAGLAGVATMILVIAAGSLLGVAALTPSWPDAVSWAWLVVLGLIATVSHLMIVHAFKRASANILAPFQYLEIGAAVLWGYVVFGDFPEAMTWVGIAIITASGLYVFHRERRRALSSMHAARSP